MRNYLIVSVIVFTLLLIGLSGCIEQDNREPEINIVGRIDGGNIILEHQGGTSIKFNELIINVSIDGNTSEITDYDVSNDNGDNSWNIGERISFYVGNLTGKEFDMQLDFGYPSNSLVIKGTLQNGELILEKV
ncbi:hypothetical protein ACFL1L_03215 [Thermoplasmatota archaeon]